MARPEPVISFEAVDPVILRINTDWDRSPADTTDHGVQVITGLTLRLRKLTGRTEESFVVRPPHVPFLREGRGRDGNTVALRIAAQKARQHVQYVGLLTDELDRGVVKRAQLATEMRVPANDPLTLTYLLEQEFDAMLSGALAVLNAKYRSLPYAERQKYRGFESYYQTVPWREAEHLDYFPRDAIDYALEHHYFMGPYPREPSGTLYDSDNPEVRRERMGIKHWLENSWEGWMFFIKTLEAADFRPEDALSLSLKKFQRHGPVTSGYDKALLQKILDAWRDLRTTATIQIDMEG